MRFLSNFFLITVTVKSASHTHKNKYVNFLLKKKLFGYIFVHLEQNVRLRPELSPKFCQLYARTRPEPDLKTRVDLQLCLR